MYKRPKGPPRRIPPKIVLSTEGKCSEPNYLDGIRSQLRLKKEQLKYAGMGLMPLTAVQAAIRKREELIRDRAYSPEDGDTTWAAFDGEEHRGGDSNQRNWDEAIRLAERERVQLANSEPCVELWFLLHLDDEEGGIDRAAAGRKLKTRFGDYEKGDESFFERLRKAGNEQDAIRRAEGLRQRHDRDGNDPHFTNPCTRMDKLVGAIRDLAKPPFRPLSREEIKDRVNRVGENFRDLGVVSLKLYGAYSRGDATAESEIQIALSFQDASKSAHFAEVRATLITTLGVSIDLVTETTVRVTPEVFANESFTLL